MSPVDSFLAAVEAGDIGSCTAWSSDAVLDATSPAWRFHRRSPDAIRGGRGPRAREQQQVSYASA